MENTRIIMAVLMYSDRIRKLTHLTHSLGPQLPYHNSAHMIDVAKMCKKYAGMEGLGDCESHILETAGLLHDIVYIRGRPDNEAKSAYVARMVLPSLGYSPSEIESVSRAILATRLTHEPTSIMEKIIRDADIDNVGRYDFFEKTELLRRETSLSRRDFYTRSYMLLRRLGYYTDSAILLRNSTREDNLTDLKHLLIADFSNF